jgi:hypothetical protein
MLFGTNKLIRLGIYGLITLGVKHTDDIDLSKLTVAAIEAKIKTLGDAILYGTGRHCYAHVIDVLTRQIAVWAGPSNVEPPPVSEWYVNG